MDDILNTAIDNNGLLNFIKSKMNDEQKETFACHFYMSLMPDVDPFPMNGDLVIQWLDYTRKDHFKRFFIKHLNLEIDYILLPKLERNNINEKHNKEQYAFTKDAFMKLSLVSNTEKGKKIREYYIELEKLV